MKIAFVIYSLANGGAEKVVSSLSRSLHGEHEVSIIVFHKQVDYQYSGELIDINCPSKTGKVNKFINIIKRANRLNKVFKEKEFDIIFTFMESATIPSLLVSNKVIASIRNNPKKFDKITRTIMKYLYPKAISLVSNSLKNKTIIEQEFNFSNVKVIPNPIDISDIDTKLNLDLSFDYQYIIAIGRLHPQKGFDMLIKAFSLVQERKGIKLLILGEGSMRSELELLIDQLNLSDEVLLVGRKENPYKYIANSEFFVLSSRYEGFPNVLLEALACEKTALAFDCDTGPSEIINHGKNGFLVEDENIEQLSEYITLLISDDKLKMNLAGNARQSILKYNLPFIKKEWLNLTKE